MTLHPHWGHKGLLKTLSTARARDSLPATLLVQGPRGVGKQHLALWLGRLLLCPQPGPEGPCETCLSCRLALRLEHPDLHWFFPLPRPKGATTPEKLTRALEETRWEVLSEIRKDPLKPLPVDGARTLYLAAARTLRRQAQNRPSMGDRQVFIIGEAETLAPGESSSEAANALLKLLEEPPPGTTLILTSGEPGRLLPTIRSRTTHLHLPPLSNGEVAEFLMNVRGVEGKEARKVGLLSQGAIGRALRLLPEGDDPGSLEKIRREAFHLLQAALAPDPAGAFRTSLAFKATGSRGLMELLESLEEWLRDLALAASEGEASPLNPGEEAYLHDALLRWSVHPPRASEALLVVDEARTLAAGNVNPQLIVFGLITALREVLTNQGTASSIREMK
jgi:DNA polymerase-3 subunit delta'